MKSICVDLLTEADTQTMAQRLAHCLVPPAVITFQGEIGAGKTSFIRAMLRGLGEQSAIKSPTFSLVESYTLQGMAVHHFDLYRIEDEAELAWLGIRDFFTEQAVCCIEWPERAGGALPSSDLHVQLNLIDGKPLSRRIAIAAVTAHGDTILVCMEKA